MESGVWAVEGLRVGDMHVAITGGTLVVTAEVPRAWHCAVALDGTAWVDPGGYTIDVTTEDGVVRRGYAILTHSNGSTLQFRGSGPIEAV